MIRGYRSISRYGGHDSTYRLLMCSAIPNQKEIISLKYRFLVINKIGVLALFFLENREYNHYIFYCKLFFYTKYNYIAK